jgi:hypothetical protein
MNTRRLRVAAMIFITAACTDIANPEDVLELRTDRTSYTFGDMSGLELNNRHPFDTFLYSPCFVRIQRQIDGEWEDAAYLTLDIAPPPDPCKLVRLRPRSAAQFSVAPHVFSPADDEPWVLGPGVPYRFRLRFWNTDTPEEHAIFSNTFTFTE